jgi:hypothetical protein
MLNAELLNTLDGNLDLRACGWIELEIAAGEVGCQSCE